MKTLKLGVDIDGVLANFDHAFARIINEVVPGTVPDGFEPADWDWTNLQAPGLTDEINNEVWRRIDANPKFWSSLDPYEENVIALRRFIYIHDDVEVYYVTSRCGPNVLRQTSVWLDAFGLYSDHRGTVVPVKNGRMKGPVYEAVGCQFSIDDRDQNVANVRAHFDLNVPRKKGVHTPYILSRSWNAGFDYPHRVDSLQQFLLNARENFNIDALAKVAR